MAETLTPSAIAQEYLTNLGVLKPGTDTVSQDTDWYIRAQVIGGLVSGAYNDLQLLENDIFPQSARPPAVQNHLFTYFPAPYNNFLPATNAQGPVLVTGLSGTVIPVSMVLTYGPNGNTYNPIVQSTLNGPSGIIQVQSVAQGAAQSLAIGSQLSISNPPSGLNSTAIVTGSPVVGTDTETYTAAAARILARLQSPPAGGTVADYINYSLQVAGVTGASPIRYIYGLGTMGVVITSGTTNIDQAINAGDPIIRQPSPELVAQVQTYLETQVPETDCVYVLPPAEVAIPVNVNVWYSSGNGLTVPTGQTLTQDELVEREITRAIYKTPAGGRIINGVGYVVLADLEQTLDDSLGNTAYSLGTYAQILADRQVLDLATTGANVAILPFQIAVPGTIVVTEVP